MSKRDDESTDTESVEAGRGLLDWSGRFKQCAEGSPVAQSEAFSVQERVERLVQDVEAFNVVGAPRVLLVDNGREFRSRAFLDACKRMGIAIRTKPES